MRGNKPHMPRTSFQEPGHYTQSDRKKIPSKDFAGPHDSFPIVTPKDVKDAAKLSGHAANPAQVRSNIKRIAKEKGFPVPKSMTKGGK